mgnify:CR=1 FL=1
MATITKRGRKWSARIRLNGVSLSHSFLTKGQAQAWATQTEAQILIGDLTGSTSHTLGDAIDRYLAECTPKKKSWRNEISHLGAIRRHDVSEIKLSKLTTEHLAGLRDDLLKSVKPQSARHYLVLVGSVLEQATKEWKWLRSNPARELKKPPIGKPRDRIFTDAEIERLTEYLSHPAATDMQRTVLACFQFALETGMRQGEITKLEWRDIEGRVATLHDTKNGDKRKVPLSMKALAVLDLRRDGSKPFDITPRRLSESFRRYCKACKIDGACFHDSRHHAVSALAGKLNPFELAKMVGHRKLDQTLQYYSVTADELANKLD